ncbi:hypothetical protein [Ichthyobacterium seriolicida]|nr:hypothetical protein [Ichthyobacterium seriolicida]
MKNITFFLSIIASISLFSQTFPDKLSYQTLIIDDKENILSDTSVTIQISLITRDALGDMRAVYNEIHRVKTNSVGVASLMIGNGIKPTSFRDVSLIDLNWDIPHKIEVRVDLDNDGEYDIHKESKLLSVPYAIRSYSTSEIDVVDNLSSHNSEVPLSANQGRVLNEGLGRKIDKSKIIDNLNSTDATEVLSAAQGKALKAEINNLGSSLRVDVLDELTSTDASKALSANQGRILLGMIQTKIDKSKIIDNLNSTDATEVLSAAQGKALKTEIGTKLNISDIVNNLTTNDATKALSAAQGKVLKAEIGTKLDISDIVNNLTTNDAAKALSAKQGRILLGMIQTKIDKSKIINNLNSTNVTEVLSAAQGKVLNPHYS